MAERPRDEIWDALEEHFGPVRDVGARGRRNAAVKRLRDAEATPEEIAVSFAWCQKSFANTVFTEMAVCMYLDRALHEAVKPVASPISIVRRMADGE